MQNHYYHFKVLIKNMGYAQNLEVLFSMAVNISYIGTLDILRMSDFIWWQISTF